MNQRKSIEFEHVAHRSCNPLNYYRYNLTRNQRTKKHLVFLRFDPYGWPDLIESLSLLFTLPNIGNFTSRVDYFGRLDDLSEQPTGSRQVEKRLYNAIGRLLKFRATAIKGSHRRD